MFKLQFKSTINWMDDRQESLKNSIKLLSDFQITPHNFVEATKSDELSSQVIPNDLILNKKMQLSYF